MQRDCFLEYFGEELLSIAFYERKYQYTLFNNNISLYTSACLLAILIPSKMVNNECLSTRVSKDNIQLFYFIIYSCLSTSLSYWYQAKWSIMNVSRFSNPLIASEKTQWIFRIKLNMLKVDVLVVKDVTLQLVREPFE